MREFLDRKNRCDIKFESIGLPLEIYRVKKSGQIKKIICLDADGLAGQIREFFVNC